MQGGQLGLALAGRGWAGALVPEDMVGTWERLLKDKAWALYLDMVGPVFHGLTYTGCGAAGSGGT